MLVLKSAQTPLIIALIPYAKRFPHQNIDKMPFESDKYARCGLNVRLNQHAFAIIFCLIRDDSCDNISNRRLL